MRAASESPKGLRIVLLVLGEAVALAIASLALPMGLSEAVVFALVAFQVLAWRVAHAPPPVTRRVLPHLLLLVAFSASYFGVLLAHGLTRANLAAWFTLLVPSAYVVGWVVGRRGPALALPGVVAHAAGFVVFATLAVRGSAQWQFVEIEERMVADPWGTGLQMNAPGLGAFASLGMCLIAPALFGGRVRELPFLVRWLYVPALVALAALGMVTNVSLQNRTPMLAAGISLAACALAVLAFRRGFWRRLAPIAVGVACAATAWTLLGADVDLLEYNLFRRFQDVGLETTRYRAWSAVLNGMFDYPEGGRLLSLGGIPYAHNLWLDVVWDAGLAPAALLVAFQLSHLAAAWRWLRHGSEYLVTLVLVALGVSMLATWMVEPVLTFSVAYFSAGCMLMGVLLGLDEWSGAAVVAGAAVPEARAAAVRSAAPG